MYDEIVAKYYKAIYSYCCVKLNYDQSAAEDVTQEVFFILYRKLKRLRLNDNIKLWLYRVADNEIKSYMRKHPTFVPIDECPDELLVQHESFPSMNESKFDILTEEERSLLTDYYSGEDKEKIAESYKLSMNGLYIRIHRIKQKLAINSSKSNNAEV